MITKILEFLALSSLFLTVVIVMMIAEAAL